MTKVFTSFWLLCMVLIVACNDGGVRKGKSPERQVYADYSISGEEGNDSVSCVFRFYKGGPGNLAVLLHEPAKVVLDGQVVQPDSARLSGIYYEVSRPLEQFKGNHEIIFTNEDGKEYRQSFEFISFSIMPELPERLPKRSLVIKLTDFPKQNMAVRLSITDTSFATNDINEIVNVANGQLHIDQSSLEKLKAGPVVLEIVREEEKPIQTKDNVGGRIIISYGLKKEFELVE